MAGHSKWANIKRRKGAVDAARGKLFTKLVKEITTAARLGGGDPDGNPRLRAAIITAKSNSMPMDNINRAVKKGTGEGGGAAIEEITYEGYGPGGVAIFIEAQTDNKNRTSSDIRSSFAKLNGNLGTNGSVAWIFKKQSHFSFDAARYSEEELMDAALEAGADDILNEGEELLMIAAPTAFGEVANYLESNKLEYQRAELTMVPENTVKVADKDAEPLFKLIERLEDLDDVQKVYANFDIDESELERISDL
ncbi:MAG: YebC/PmpR family DNA-binding transcriptional regulator [Myxococcales bacterium]|nr:YebC/PmpR family DNA-binding transcriptional regulator [Myxococcales bacterium]